MTTPTEKLETFNRSHNRGRDREIVSNSFAMAAWANRIGRDLFGVLGPRVRNKERVRLETDKILFRAPEEGAADLRKLLSDSAMWSWDSATRRFVRAVPIPVWLRRLLPVHSLFSTEGREDAAREAFLRMGCLRERADEMARAAAVMGMDLAITYGRNGNLLEFTPDISQDDAFQRILSGELTAEQTRAVIRELEFGSPTAAELNAILEDTYWPDGLDAMSRIKTVITPDLAELRDNIGKYLSTNVDVEAAWQTLSGEIEHLVGNVRFKAVRIARTETARVSEDMLRQSWKEADEFIVGIKTFTANDSKVRGANKQVPHKKWEKKEFFRTSAAGGYVARDGEPLPRFPAGPNCRCWSSPMLDESLTRGLPDEDLGPEYKAAVDRFEREKVEA